MVAPKQRKSQCYQRPNPISPELFYQSAKRIFSRSTHDCLSSDDKPKAIEVLLKFTRLYDYCSFSNDEDSKKTFKGDTLYLDYGLD